MSETPTRRKVCVVTGTRADYGLLRPVLERIRADEALQLQLVVSGMHLAPEFGLTYREIEQDGFACDEKVELLLSSDTPVGIATSMGLGTIGFANAFARLQPDWVVLLGDRFEALAAAQAALVARIPLAHLAGGDTTEGAVDEAIRHSLTKMAHLHFVTNEVARQRVLQMGEDPATVHNVGSSGIDALLALALPSRETLETELGIRLRARNILITFHPATLDPQPAPEQMQALLDGLASLGPEVGLIFTYPNADAGGRALIAQIDAFVATHPHARAFASLGQRRYLGLMACVDAVVGNSSSGLYEAPSFKVPTVNIGSRQQGRLQATSVLNCAPVAAEIARTVERAFALDCRDAVNPYGDGRAAGRIIVQLKAIEEPRRLLQKTFHMPGGSA